MATHHSIIISGIKHHVEVGDYSGLRESGPLKKEMRKVMKKVMLMKMITAAMVPPVALRRHWRGGEGLPFVLSTPWPPP